MLTINEWFVKQLRRYQTYVALLRSRLEGVGGSKLGGIDVMTELPVFEGSGNREEAVVPPPIPQRQRYDTFR